MWKWIRIYKDEKEFAKWAKTIEKKLKGEILDAFKEAWPSLSNTNEAVRGSFVYYWELRTNMSQFHSMAQPMSIGYLAYLADGAQSVGREDIVNLVNNMIRNIPRINLEISNSLVAKMGTDKVEVPEEGGKDEEE